MTKLNSVCTSCMVFLGILLSEDQLYSLLQANKIGKINLAATGKDLMEEEKPGDVTIYLYAALDMETEAVAERSKELFTNQKLGLLNGFLVVDDW